MLPPGTAGEGRRYPELDGLRGVALLAVLFNHFTLVHPQSMVDRWLVFTAHFGWIGVDIFFVLSGFLITGILLDSLASPRYFRSFYARRVLRIFPVYYAVLLLVLVVLPLLLPTRFADASDSDPYQWTYWFFLANLGMAWENAFHHRLLGPMWSLAIEEQFYLAWPLVVLAVRRGGLMVLCPLLIVGSFVLRMLMLHVWEFGHVTVYVTTFARLDGLAAGAWVAAALRGGWDPLRWAKPLAALALACATLAYSVEAWQLVPASGSVYQRGEWGLGPGITLSAIASAAVIAMLVSSLRAPTLRGVLNWRVLRSLGKYSFAIYLTHSLLRVGLRDLVFGPAEEGASPLIAFEQLSANPWVGQLLFYLLAGSASWCVGWLSWNLLERHVLKLKRYFPY